MPELVKTAPIAPAVSNRPSSVNIFDCARCRALACRDMAQPPGGLQATLGEPLACPLDFENSRLSAPWKPELSACPTSARALCLMHSPPAKGPKVQTIRSARSNPTKGL